MFINCLQYGKNADILFLWGYDIILNRKYIRGREMLETYLEK